MYLRIAIKKDEMPELIELVQAHGFRNSSPMPFSSASEGLNAPLSGQEIMDAIETITIVLKAGTALNGFAASLIKLLQKNGSSAQIASKDNPEHKKIDGKSKSEEITKDLK